MNSTTDGKAKIDDAQYGFVVVVVVFLVEGGEGGTLLRKIRSSQRVGDLEKEKALPTSATLHNS